jgi:ATP-dependent helicase HrpA
MKVTTAELMALRERLALTRYADRPRLARQLDRLFARTGAGTALSTAMGELERGIDASASEVERLRTLPLKFEYDAELPIAAHRDEILTALKTRQVVVVCGATGSGKTTQLPKLCMEAGCGAFGLIGHTQPRRIAARSIAARLAAELGTTVGAAVGYQVRFNDRTGADCRVKVMTDGILLRELEHDRLLRRYDALIVDEAHERSLNIDFLLGVLRQLLPRRPDLKIVITSATIDPQRFAEFFGCAPIIEVSGRSYPVEIRYRPLAQEDEEVELSLPEGIVAAVRELDRNGDILVFLPGEKQIREANEALVKAKLSHTEVLPLYARLSTRDQERIFERHAARRIVLSTNVAETSLTVPGIKYVIDSGLARISRYSVRGKVQRLPIEPISQASAQQRAGRCGRESAGICIRLYDEEGFATREAFTPPEILRTNLASVILQMVTLGLGDPQDFPFLDPPDTRLINDGYRLLQELKAVDEARRVTSLGRQIAAVPVDPRLARMLLAAAHHACVAEMLVLTAFLAGQDPRERPAEALQQADEKHAAYADARSDFITVLNLWKLCHDRQAELSGSQLRKWCREQFLSFVRLREWQELHRQLGETAAELELRPNQLPTDYAQLHQAILTGFLGGIGALDEKREYEGARGSRFVIAPGTALAARPPKWIVAASLIETTRLYARMAAAIEPQWIEAAGAHLLKRNYSEPHWVEERGFVAAFESTSLYGLTLSSRRRVNYGSVAPRAACEIFVREALVEGRTHSRVRFLEHNRALRSEVEKLEAKVRRRDILIDEQALCDFYLARLPEHVNTDAGLKKWLASAPAAALQMTPSDLMRRTADEITAASHPDALDIGGNRLQLEYRFEPGATDDGATLIVPEPLIEFLDEHTLSWLIPGWLMEKIVAALRGLPKHVRKSFVPVPDYALRAMDELDRTLDFSTALAAWATRTGGVALQAAEIPVATLPDHLRFNIHVTDLNGARIAEDRDLRTLRRKVSTHRADVQSPAERSSDLHRQWDFGALPVERSVQRQGLRFVVHPTLRDGGQGVYVTEARSPAAADATLRSGVLRLILLALPDQVKYVRKKLSDQSELALLGQGLGAGRSLIERAAEKCFADCFLPPDLAAPRSATEFQALIDARRGELGASVDRSLNHILDVLSAWRTIRRKLADMQAPTFRAAVQQIESQLLSLVPENFPLGVPEILWPHLPRYLKALARRLERIAGNVARDAELSNRVQPFERELARLYAAARGLQRPQPELDKLRWAIEEFRVSLFAQDLRTAMPVSERRLQEQVARAAAEAQHAS